MRSIFAIHACESGSSCATPTSKDDTSYMPPYGIPSRTLFSFSSSVYSKGIPKLTTD